MKNLIKHFLLGILIGAILAPSTAQAQFTVFDPAQYSLQIERQIEEANRWLERVRQYSEEINKMAEQLSTMKGILGQADKLVLHNANLTRTMAAIVSSSSGSSAGSASTVAAGLVGFALGSETLGSIVSPCRQVPPLSVD